MADIHRLNRALSCPQPLTYRAYPRGVYRLLSECWVTVLYRHLPGIHLVGLLVGDTAYQGVFRTSDDCIVDGFDATCEDEVHDYVLLNSLTPGDIEEAVHLLEGSRHDLVVPNSRIRKTHGHFRGEVLESATQRPVCGNWIDDEYFTLSKWILDLRVIGKTEREKHWPPSHVKTQDALRSLSLQKGPEGYEGWLNADTSLENLKRVALAAISHYFRSCLEAQTATNFIGERVDVFLELWRKLFLSGNFRLGVTHDLPVGMWGGKESWKMVYDFDPSGRQFHCYPVGEFPSVAATMHEGQLEF